MRARHPAWFREDLARLFELLAARAIQPRVAERISFAEVAEAHRRLEAGLCGRRLLSMKLRLYREGSFWRIAHVAVRRSAPAGGQYKACYSSPQLQENGRLPAAPTGHCRHPGRLTRGLH
nr:zinc-binding dehydrogenase [Bradyrhizobium sp. Cp5.3]